MPEKTGVSLELTPMLWSGREDLNFRPRRPERRALPGCATPRRKSLVYKTVRAGVKLEGGQQRRRQKVARRNTDTDNNEG